MLIDELNLFFKTLENNSIELYNEAGLQHEIGYFLRTKGYDVKFEYNISLIEGVEKLICLKSELDIFVKEPVGKSCIEIKFPTKGAYPRRMMQSLIDLFLLKQLKNAGFVETIFIFISPLKCFTSGKEAEVIYSYFRKSKDLSKFSITDIPQFMLGRPEVIALNKLLNENKLSLAEGSFIKFHELTLCHELYYYFIISIE